MKKKKISTLKLNKQSISNFETRKIHGGDTGTVKLCFPSETCPTYRFTCGNCFQTIGDPECPSILQTIGW